MKKWLFAFAWVVVIPALPVMADDEGADESADAKTKAESPIKRLAELQIDEYVVPARMINVPLPGRTQTVQDILDKLDRFAKDDQIGGLLLNINAVVLSLPDVQEITDGIDRFKETEKPVMAFLSAGGGNAYLMACHADEIAMAPNGALAIPGIGNLFPFMKGYYQMMGVEFDVITAGKYKYPGFINRREPDKYFLEEFSAVLDSWFSEYKRIIREHRDLSEEDVAKNIDIALFTPDAAQQRGLIDTLGFFEDYRERVLKRTKMKRYRDFGRTLADVNSLQDFVELINREMEKAEEARKAVGPKIAVLNARGPIVDATLGSAFSSMVISRDTFVDVIKDIRKNKSIKAVVLRVDSPGGSGYASDVIWQELRRLDEEKPLVVSMGRVAGSGGYYIACPGRRIFAQPTTITGSIGVLGVFQCAWSMFNRMDYEFAEMQRGARSLLGAPNRDMSKEDRQFIQDYMNSFYDVFVGRVAQTRRIPEDRVREIAEGRIYTGKDALALGLVDELGGLADAINAARDIANIPPSAELKIVHYPRASSFGELFETLGVSSPGMVETLASMSRAVGPAAEVSFDAQLSLFSQRFQPLCWMATPPFWQTGTSLQSGLTGFGAMPSFAPMPAGASGFGAMIAPQPGGSLFDGVRPWTQAPAWQQMNAMPQLP